ncbi:MAG TPA: hypothetical protein VL995_04350 [Cellvibrio sp.]|nr:hypothetical protein [Cellvibrio sp.]
MKIIGFWCFLIISISSFADEPRVQAECKFGYKEYHLNKTKIQLCPNEDGSYKVDATAVGGNYHTCWWPLTLSKKSEGFSASEGDCTLNVIFGEGKLSAQFTGQCRDSCGMRASFNSGDFVEKLATGASNKKTLDTGTATQPPAIQLWTGNKLLAGDIAACALKTEEILNYLGFTSISKSVYPTETYFYANFVGNRAGIHCTNIAGQTFVYGSVAGTDVKTVELLRNRIFGKF